MSEVNRDSREAVLRESDERIKKHLARLKMGYVGELDIPLEDIPEGMEYRWVRDTVLGDPSMSRFAQMYNAGFVPVPQSRHPNLGDACVPWRKGNDMGYIFKRGLILCERPRYIGEEEEKLAEKKNMEMLYQSPANAELLGNPMMPVRVFNNAVARHTTFKNT